MDIDRTGRLEAGEILPGDFEGIQPARLRS